MSSGIVLQTRAFARRALASIFVVTAIAQSVPKPLTGTYWKAVELAGKPALPQAGTRDVHLQFQVNGRASGFDGCNQVTGPYTLSGDNLTFGRMAATQMACMDTSGTEQAFRAVLEHTRRFRIDGDKLELFDDGGIRLAVFEARQ